ncbi:hypothetical protein GCM10025865_19500 [Paraoerskovia sediminicola]|uniref:HTH luxR-type domain-containing protein n=1 Tax=Paraoerskovia sediminicola TaxID=1138587 RepID=A0ABN6XCT7_9CELL|nr:hypothetical protein GCM10025865_19500 [Paraoerskovia sediminicola]
MIETEGTTQTDRILTRREKIVLDQLLRGLTLEQVARELFVSRNTVKTQTRSIYRKLGVSTRAELRASTAGTAGTAGSAGAAHGSQHQNQHQRAVEDARPVTVTVEA